MSRGLLLAFLALSGSLASLQAEAVARTDAHGDPLPAGAVARIGTVRFRHGAAIISLAYSADGKRITSTDGRTVAVWDAHTGRTLAFRFLPPQYQLWSPVVSPDGSLIACWLESGALGVQEAESGKERCALPLKDGRIYALEMSRDNRWLASADPAEGNVFLWDLKARKLARKWKSPARSFFASYYHAFTPDSQTLVHATQTGHVFLWDVRTGKEIWHIEPDKDDDFLNGVAISPDGELLATRNRAGRFDLREVKTGRFLRELGTFPNYYGLGFSRDSKHVLGGNSLGEICFWEVATAKLTRKLGGVPDSDPNSLACSPDGKYLAVGRSNHAVRLWDLAAGKELVSTEYRLWGYVSARFLSDGKTLFTHRLLDQFRYADFHLLEVAPRLGFWDLKGKSLRQTTFDLEQAHEFALTRDAGTVALAEGPNFRPLSDLPVPNGSLRSLIRLKDLASGKDLARVDKLPCQIDELGFAPDGRFLFAYALNAGPNAEDYHRTEVVQVWKRTQNTLKKIAEHPADGFLRSFHCPADSQWIGVPSKQGWSFYDCETGKLLRSGAALSGAVRASSPSGRVLVHASDDEKTANLVELASGKTIAKLECDPRYLHRPRFAVSPDGRIVAGDLNSETITLWDAFTGKPLGKLAGHRGDICSLCFSPDGRYLVSGSADTTVLIWDYRSALPKTPAAPRHTPERLEQLWTDLQGDDAGRGYRAVADLVRTPEQAVALLRKKIAPPTADDQRRIQGWIDDLGSNRFPTRSRAEAELTRLSDLAEPALRQALRQKPDLEKLRRIEALVDRLVSVPPGPWLATLRAFDALELIGTPEAKRLLEELSNGAADSPQTHEARRSLERLNRRRAAEAKSTPG